MAGLLPHPPPMEKRLSAGEDVTRLLASHREGDEEALNRLFPLVYGELRQLAHRQLGRGGRGTLHAARAMRQILIDHARRHLAHKRGGGAPHLTLEENDVAVEARAEELIDLDAALDRLGKLDDRAGRPAPRGCPARSG